MHIHARNVSEALWLGYHELDSRGILRQSRAGEMVEYPEPVMTTYTHPCERVLFYPERDANPFFHLFESLWMLGGRSDVEFLTKYNKRMAEYSTDGYHLRGAYGYRWRHWFGHDQIELAIQRLKTYENDRRTVIAMWDGTIHGDLQAHDVEKDLPCNTHIYLKVRDGALNMTVCCRSNDMIWGAYGANAVHFSVLQEYIALRVGCRVGSYTQLSDSYHAYLTVFNKLNLQNPDYDPYLTLGEDGLHYTPEPLWKEHETSQAFDHDVKVFLNEDTGGYQTEFFKHTIWPMEVAYDSFKGKKYDHAIEVAERIQARDWRKACVEWLERRKK